MSNGLRKFVFAAVVAAIPVSAIAGKPQPQPAAVQPPAYYAANGALVGPLSDGHAIVRLGGLTFAVEMQKFELTTSVGGAHIYRSDVHSTAQWRGGAVFFDQPGCTGNAYIELVYDVVSGFSGFATVIYDSIYFSQELVDATTGATLYVARTDQAPQHLGFGPVAGILSVRRSGQCFEGDGWNYLVNYSNPLFAPVVATYDLSTMFPLPLTIR